MFVIDGNEIKEASDLRNLLHYKSLEVSFFKKSDGSPRVMLCTLNPDDIPTEKTPESGITGTSGKSNKGSNEELIAVYSPTVSGWRSFYWGNVFEIKQG